MPYSGEKQVMNHIFPIFILGAARTGTTYLANTLCGHKFIACAQHKVHWGFHESNIMHKQLYWKDFNDINKYIHFLELYSSGDHFKLVNGDKEYFYRNRPKDFYDFYFTLMDRYVESINAKCWLTKFDPLHYADSKNLSIFLKVLKERYKKIRFISIKRDIKPGIRSYLNMEGDKYKYRTNPFFKYFACILYCARFVCYYDMIKKVSTEYDVFFVDLKELIGNKEKNLKRMCDFLNIPYDQSILTVKYKLNTSKKSNFYNEIISDGELQFLEKTIYQLFCKFPCIAKIIVRSRDRYIKKSVPAVNWRITKYEYMKEAFANELINNNAYALCKNLFGKD